MKNRMLVLALVTLLAAVAHAHVALRATLDGAQEVPPVSTTATATATFTFLDENKTLDYTVTIVQPLTGGPIVQAHIHEGLPGQAGDVLIPLETDLQGTSDLSANPNLDDFLAKLFAGATYVNVHTPAHPAGEIRGQITLVPGKCGCDAFPNHGQFVKCVRQEIKKLDKAERQEDAIKALKKASARSSCGKKHGPKKAIACCLPRNPEENIVTDSLCLATSESKCAAKGGTSQGAGSSCFAASPCP